MDERMLKRIKEVYSILYVYLDRKNNTPTVRSEVRKILDIFLRYHVDRIICDETNNTPEVVDQNILLVRLEYGDGKYIDLPFGKNDYELKIN